jgi:transcriptional regulator with XRE-family HTH domain
MAALADKFATNLKSERLRRKLSQEALAAKAGLSVSYISMLERGQRTPPLDTLESLAKALSVSPTHLLVPAPAQRRGRAVRRLAIRRGVRFSAAGGGAGGRATRSEIAYLPGVPSPAGERT